VGLRRKWLNVLTEVTKERNVENLDLAGKKVDPKNTYIMKAISKCVRSAGEGVTFNCYLKLE
jgi:hypothetical protein